VLLLLLLLAVVIVVAAVVAVALSSNSNTALQIQHVVAHDAHQAINQFRNLIGGYSK
jgi:beta-lactam-binding protein with PASTA domain